MIKKIILSLALIPALLVIAGCSHRMRSWTGLLKPKAFMNITTGMDKKQVILNIGEPDILRGSSINTSGHVVELWEYVIERHEFGTPPYKQIFWLQFNNGKLVQWGKAGDWEKAPDSVKEVRHR